MRHTDRRLELRALDDSSDPSPVHSGVNRRKPSAPGSKLLSQHAAQRSLQRLVLALDMIAERRVYHRLIVSATSIVDLLLKPSQQVVVNPNRNPSLALG